VQKKEDSEGGAAQRPPYTPIKRAIRSQPVNDNLDARNSSGFQNAAGDSARISSSRIFAMTPATNALLGSPAGCHASCKSCPPVRDFFPAPHGNYRTAEDDRSSPNA